MHAVHSSAFLQGNKIESFGTREWAFKSNCSGDWEREQIEVWERKRRGSFWYTSTHDNCPSLGTGTPLSNTH